MPAPITAGSHAAPSSVQRGARFIADPATTEAQVLDFGLFTREVVEAAMARPAKSEALIAELLHTVSGAFGVRADAGTLVDALLTEPALSSANLAAMARLIQCGLVEETSQRLVAVCTHPRCKDYTLVVALWNATPQITSAVALSGRPDGRRSRRLGAPDLRGGHHLPAGRLGCERQDQRRGRPLGHLGWR